MQFTRHILDELVADGEIQRGSPLYARALNLLRNGPAQLGADEDEELLRIVGLWHSRNSGPPR